MKLRNFVLLAVAVFGMALSAMAAEIDGKWNSTFNTQIGEQHYTYTFKADGDKLTGTAKNDNGSTEIQNGSIKGDDISFVENIEFNGMKIAITYTGKITGDQIKFTREVGTFVKEEIVATRAK